MPGVEFDLSRTLDDLRFPIGSFAEWNAVLQNVLTNAWNAMLDSDDAIVSIDAGTRPQAAGAGMAARQRYGCRIGRSAGRVAGPVRALRAPSGDQ